SYPASATCVNSSGSAAAPKASPRPSATGTAASDTSSSPTPTSPRSPATASSNPATTRPPPRSTRPSNGCAAAGPRCATPSWTAEVGPTPAPGRTSAASTRSAPQCCTCWWSCPTPCNVNAAPSSFCWNCWSSTAPPFPSGRWSRSERSSTCSSRARPNPSRTTPTPNTPKISNFYRKVRLWLLDKHEVTEADVGTLDVRSPFRRDDLLVKTLLLSALTPQVPALKDLTVGRVMALNQGIVKARRPRQDRSEERR